MKITGWWFANVERHFVGFRGFNRNAKLNNRGQSYLNTNLVCVKYSEFILSVFEGETETIPCGIHSQSYRDSSSTDLKSIHRLKNFVL